MNDARFTFTMVPYDHLIFFIYFFITKTINKQHNLIITTFITITKLLFHIVQ